MKLVNIYEVKTITRWVENFHYREWTPPTERRVPHSCNRLGGYACDMRLHVVERTGYTCIMHFHDRSFEDSKFRARLDRTHNVSRKDTLQPRQIRGDKTRHANSLCKCRFLQPRNRFITGDTVISQVHV